LSSSYVIRHGELELHIAIADIADLYLHEEVLPKLLGELERAIDSDSCLKHPVIVDSGSHVVLDGMHRIAALKKLGCMRVPACFVDYSDPAITVGCWYRAIKGAEALQDVAAEVEEMGFLVEEARNLEEEQIGVPPVLAAIKNTERNILIQASFRGLKEAYDLVGRIEEGLRNSSFEVLYETEKDALRMLLEGTVDAVLLTPRLTKNSIITTALSGEVFSYKATRHVVPARPLHVDVPLSLLRGDRRLDEVNEELRRVLEGRRLRLVPAGNIFEGRRYEEDIYVFEESA